MAALAQEALRRSTRRTRKGEEVTRHDLEDLLRAVENALRLDLVDMSEVERKKYRQEHPGVDVVLGDFAVTMIPRLTPEQRSAEAAWRCAAFERRPIGPEGAQAVYVCRIENYGGGEALLPRYNYFDGEWKEVPVPEHLFERSEPCVW